MTVVEAIYLVAAVLWIVVVLAVVGVGGRYLLKLRSRRRRVNRLIKGVRLPVGRIGHPYRAVAGGGIVMLQVLSQIPLQRLVRGSVSSARGR